MGPHAPRRPRTRTHHGWTSSTWRRSSCRASLLRHDRSSCATGGRGSAIRPVHRVAGRRGTETLDDPLDLEFGFVADGEPAFLEDRLAQAERERPATSRHRVRRELLAVDDGSDALLLEATESRRDLRRDVGDREPRYLLRMEVPDGREERTVVGHDVVEDRPRARREEP